MKIVIIGAGTTAITVADILVKDRNFTIAGFIGTDEEETKLSGKKLYDNIPFIGSHRLLKKLKDDDVVGFITAIGDNYIRERRYYEATLNGLTPINAISHNAVIETSARIGKGVMISSGCIVSHGVTIGDNTCFDPGVIVEINTKIGENCNLSSGCIVGGMCEIGRNVVLGPRSTISHNTSIGKNNSIKAGKVIDKDIEDLVRNQK